MAGPTPLLSLACSLLLGPPEPAPGFDEPIVIEAAPLPGEDPSEPPQVEPPQVEPPQVEPLAVPDGGRVPMGLPPPPPPPDGSGRLVGGALTIGLGVAAFVTLGAELQRSEGNPTYVASTFAPFGIAALGIGTYLLVRGGKARANFNHWKRFTGYEVPRQGSGLLVGGTMATVVGGVSLIIGSLRSTRGQYDAGTTALLSIGGAGVVAGGTQLALGLVRRERYRRWQRGGLFVLAPPLVAPRPEGGWMVGLAGRF